MRGFKKNPSLVLISLPISGKDCDPYKSLLKPFLIICTDSGHFDPGLKRYKYINYTENQLLLQTLLCSMLVLYSSSF